MGRGSRVYLLADEVNRTWSLIPDETARVPVFDKPALAVLARLQSDARHGRHAVGHLLALAIPFVAKVGLGIAAARLVLDASLDVVVLAGVAAWAAGSRNGFPAVSMITNGIRFENGK